ncbi:MAG TPA: PSD1 and planctomycete cytochrome C domain-containing protein [Gemmata sp.]|nr:PSD1 and planctomycete cytochrome C domain-containing protein [Gemmata sp.]
MRTSTLTLVLLLASAGTVCAEEPVNNEFFERKVRPILIANCINCHGAQKQKGGLRLDARTEFIKGGDNGAAIVPGDPAKSRLIQVIKYDGDIKMPQKGKLPDAEIGILTAWVKGGAPWPNDVSGVAAGTAGTFDLHARAKAQWSFQPIKRPQVPTVPNAKSTNPIDRFLLAKLNDNGLSFAPAADKRTLLRRVYFDLIGLPPSSEEIDTFLKDNSSDAYEKVVEKLLASPAYGERWARHWLDLARYAETYGHEFDFEIFEAWRYRDYVVRAFNADVPFNQFLTEQLAGDLLASPRRDPKTGVNESLLATGFWWLGESTHSPVDSRGDFSDRVSNQVDVFGKTVLGLTLACARCHDHKFDAISTKDYYALFGVFASSRYSRTSIDDPAPTVKLLDELKRTRAELTSALTVARVDKPADPENSWRSKSVAFERFDAGWRQRWDAIGLAFRPEAGEGYPHSGREVRKLSGSLRSPTFTIDKPFLAVRIAGREARMRLILNGLQLIQDPIYGRLAVSINHGEEFRWHAFDLRMWKGQPAYLELIDDGPGYVAIREAWFSDTPPPADAVEKASLPETPPANTPEAKKLAEQIRELEAKIPDSHRALTMRDGTGVNEHVFVRGNHKTLGVEAPRAFLEAFGKPAFAGTGSGRLQLAELVTDPSNPLVARVFVNRLWQHHFGEGIVRSPDDFGRQGQPPTHPELLDWLASELVNPSVKAGLFDTKPQPWGIKHMHRLIVQSEAYRQSSKEEVKTQKAESTRDPNTIDPQNKLLHRQNVRRLEAEAIRDSILAVSGRLDRTMEGPGVLLHLTEHEVGRGKPPSGPLDSNGRRSIYLAVRRNFLNPMFTAFDYPTPFTTMGRRSVSNVPAQALVMLNNPFVLQQAELWAKRVQASRNSTSEERIRAMYESGFGRLPTKPELDAAMEFLAEQGKEYGKVDAPKAWSDLAHVLFNAKEFIFVE